jgi:SAM-dependent methyltransferase
MPRSAVKNGVRFLFGWQCRQQLLNLLRRAKHFGRSRYCPCCGAHVRKFLPFGNIPRPDARCPICGSLERHRLMWLYLPERTDICGPTPKKLLHVAPELQLATLFRSIPSVDYLSGDLSFDEAMVRMDITDIQFPDQSFDIIHCSHVLEHVSDDRKAMREICRVLKPGGWAILQVPFFAEVSWEDPSVTDPKERERLFGQHDHVRAYGKDYRDRLVDAGFSVTVDDYVRTIDRKKATLYGLDLEEDIYLCRKPAG